MIVLSVVGARPNFMKLAPLHRDLMLRERVEHVIVHTGQHYDSRMSEAFFEDLCIPQPHYNLGVGSRSHARQTAAVMERFEPLCATVKPDIVVVYGDVNSTVAAALVAVKLGVQVAHVEAGLRSYDWSMPEEINRLVTDRLSSMLFAPSRDAVENLLAEGIQSKRIHLVGNIMIDSLVRALPQARRAGVAARLGLRRQEYVVVTLHRPSNVDDPCTLRELVDTLAELAAENSVVFPVHPRTRRRMQDFAISTEPSSLRLLEPLGYIEMLSLVQEAGLVITDSGGLQEETSYLGIPCLTVRPNTERPVTVTHGTNQLVPSRKEAIVDAARAALDLCNTGNAPRIEHWDGKAAQRIATIICDGSRYVSDSILDPAVARPLPAEW